MAFPNSPESNPQYPGQENLAGDLDALFKDKFKPAVGQLLMEEEKLSGIFEVVSLNGSKTYTEPAVGRTITKTQENRGDFLSGEKIEHAENTIGCDRPEYAKVSVDQVDEAMSNLLIKPVYRTRMARAIGRYRDGYRICELVKAARATHALTSEVGGSVITGVDLTTPTTKADQGEVLYHALESAIQTMREKDVEDSLTALLTYAQRTMLHNYIPLINKDYGGPSDVTDEDVKNVLGLNIIYSNTANQMYGVTIDGTQVGLSMNVQSNHYVNMLNTVGLVFADQALLETSLTIKDEGWFLIDREEHLETAVQNVIVRGCGVRDPRYAIELSSLVA